MNESKSETFAGYICKNIVDIGPSAIWRVLSGLKRVDDITSEQRQEFREAIQARDHAAVMAWCESLPSAARAKVECLLQAESVERYLADFRSQQTQEESEVAWNATIVPSTDPKPPLGKPFLLAGRAKHALAERKSGSRGQQHVRLEGGSAELSMVELESTRRGRGRGGKKKRAEEKPGGCTSAAVSGGPMRGYGWQKKSGATAGGLDFLVAFEKMRNIEGAAEVATRYALEAGSGSNDETSNRLDAIRALSRLEQNELELVVTYLGNDGSINATAKKMGMSESTVRRNIARVRERAKAMANGQ